MGAITIMHGRGRTWSAADEPFVTCEAVISESLFLLERAHEGKEPLCRLLERGIVIVESSLPSRLTGILRLLRRYDDTPMSLADACLVLMSEQREDSAIFATDSDFRMHRKNGRQVIPLIMPE